MSEDDGYIGEDEREGGYVSEDDGYIGEDEREGGYVSEDDGYIGEDCTTVLFQVTMYRQFARKVGPSANSALISYPSLRL